MNELTKTSMQLPDTIEDLSKFVLVNEEKVQALRAQIRAIRKVSLAKEVYEQKLAEAQEIGQITVEAAQKMGELLLQIQTAQGRRTDLTSSEVRTKSEQLHEIGITRQRSSEYEQMAQNPEAVQAAIQKAIENGDVVSRTQVMKEISALKAELRKAQEREPEIRTVTKEVYPSDYDDLKQKARLSDAHEKDFQDMRNRYEQMTEKWKKSEREKDALIAEKNDPAAQKTQRLHLNAVSFCAGVSNFLERFGGYTYLMEEINELPDGERKAVFNSLNAVYEWVNDMLGTVAEE